LYQLPDLQTPTLEELQRITKTSEVGNRVHKIQAALNKQFENNFLADYLAAVVEELSA
jgi:hypothetical protein